ncbi:phosphoenolpyruvate carboxykinase (ATP) [Yeguia hominis]|uniref:Phosphoenolpyruvate carboxykinase (ATP) n=1 Tax=Yeguia hominis TaxID=2763662 RepID=A0A926D4X2_9FIRM|nr:phosphoenolpyruvate carboxykinase (ATP) [Yeguia hominis]MBC8532480.1 phosphoenolpyruvate carboxykinase (ATP) [Yeguia hominis]
MKTLTALELGIAGDGTVYRNLAVPSLVEEALFRGEGRLSDTGALVVETGKYTGRSPDDKFIVDTPAVHDEIAWGKINVPIEESKFSAIKAKMLAYLQNRDLFVFDGFAGADPKYRQRFRIVNELASQNLFIHELLIRPTKEELEDYEPDYTVIAAPGFKCIPGVDGVHSEAAIIINYETHEVLIAGSGYSGEIKKSVFSVMNYVLPKKGLLSMHCSANIGDDGDSAVFFGLSGTGKTTLSADPARKLIGDDEHGWSDDGIFNIEGGCYAKCIGLEREHEPEIYDAIKFGTLLENVIVDDDGKPDYADGSLTENTRAGYPIDYIPNAAIPGVGGQPKTIIFLTADAFGVLPPIAKLDNDMAMYHFVSGYTSKLAGTERGITEPVTTFSTLFGAPFFPLNPSVYATMLGEKLKKTGANVFLVNTGWCGGAAGTVPRMKLKYTRAMVSAALAGELNDVEYELDPIFNVNIPKSCPNVPAEILNPRNVWKDQAAYEQSAKNLAAKFAENFAKKYPDMPKNIVEAGPKA